MLRADENSIDCLIDFYRRHNFTKSLLVTGYCYQKPINIESSNINKKKILHYYNFVFLIELKKLT